MDLDDKRARLCEIIRGYGAAAVAFSGGVDSSLLCAVAREVLGDGALAVTVVSPFLPRSELADARKVAALVGIKHILVESSDIEEDVAANPADRCYHCKKREFGEIAAAARESGIGIVLDGTNVDDEGDYRPGMTIVVPVVRGGKAIGLLNGQRSGDALVDLVKDAKIGASGYVFLVSGDGTVIAHPQRERVVKKENYLVASERDPSLKALADLEKKMIAGESGAGSYRFEGRDRIMMRAKPSSDSWSMRSNSERSEERRVGKECRSRWSPYH